MRNRNKTSWLDKPLTMRGCMKCTALGYLIVMPIMYAYTVYEGIAPGPKEIVETLEEKYWDESLKLKNFFKK